MRTKSDRRHSFTIKHYLKNKHEKSYTFEKLHENIRLTNLESSKHAVKTACEIYGCKVQQNIENLPLIVKNSQEYSSVKKLNKMIDQARENQIKKILNFLKKGHQNVQFIQKDNNFFYTKRSKQSKEFEQEELVETYIFENIQVKVPKNMRYVLDIQHQADEQKPTYKFCLRFPKIFSSCDRYFYTTMQNNRSRFFASTYLLMKEKLNVKNGNFQRYANSLLEKLVRFNKLLEKIEN